MATTAGLWGVVLAGGEGTRVRPLIARLGGGSCPKQYFAFTGGRSMLQHTLDRIDPLVSPDRVFTVVQPDHLRYVKAQLGTRTAHRIVVQPANRETAPGVLLPLCHILARDPDAIVAIFPSDHFIAEEEKFLQYIAAASRVASRRPDHVVLLGAAPDGPETDYGWMDPGEIAWHEDGVETRTVVRFIEKPNPAAAQRLFSRRALWNTMVTVARGRALFRMVQRSLPRLHDQFRSILRVIGTRREQRVVEAAYRDMQTVNFSRGLLERHADELLVVRMHGVLWSDWGSERRIIETLARTGRRVRGAIPGIGSTPDLPPAVASCRP